MILGPVCHFELIRIARRRRSFVARVVFGLILLGVIGINFLSLTEDLRFWYDPTRSGISIRGRTALGQPLFALLMAA